MSAMRHSTLSTNTPSFRLISGNIMRGTEKAILFSTENLEGEIVQEWIPLSQVKEIHRDPDGVQDTILVAEWILRKRGLIE